MLSFVIKRLVMTAAVLIAASIVAFGLVHLSGDPTTAIAGEGAQPEAIELIRKQFGFDQPLIVQYGNWLGKIVKGELGYSHYLKKSAFDVLAERLPVTVQLGIYALLFALALSFPLGIMAALYPNTIIDRTALAIAVIGQSVPSFVVSYGLIYYFSVYLRWLPISGSSTWQHFIMPTIALGLYATPALMRLTRAGMLDTLRSDYIRTARAKGLPEWKVILKHALRNAVIPVVSLTAVQFGFLLGGSIVVETIFSFNGIGNLAWQSIQRSDFEVIQALVLVIAFFYSILTLLADLINMALNPRIRVR